MDTAARIALGAPGLLSFIALIVWLRWAGTAEDQKKDEPPKVSKLRERQAWDEIDLLAPAAALGVLR